MSSSSSAPTAEASNGTSAPASAASGASSKPTKAQKAAAIASQKTSKAAAALDRAAVEAKRAARKAKKEKEAEEAAKRELEGMSAPTVGADGKPLFVQREWGTVQGRQEVQAGEKKVRVLSWNMLAQGLVRRKLFPGSDCLKWKDREAGLSAELVAHAWDVGCFQEVDRLSTHTATLRKAGYAHLYTKGYDAKQHGLLIAWRTRPRASGTGACFEEQPIGTHTLFFDDAPVAGPNQANENSPSTASEVRTGCSRVTRNIALFAALRFKSGEGGQNNGAKGLIVATTHLFWHPMHPYERARQAGVLVRELTRFRERKGAEWEGWHVVLAGDFNDQPHSLTYALLTGKPLTKAHAEDLRMSTVVHQSIDEKAARKAQAAASGADVVSRGEDQAGGLDGASATGDEARQTIDGEDEDEEGGADEEADGEGEGEEDHVLKNCRPAQPSDGLLSLAELTQLHDLSRPPPSGPSSISQEAPGSLENSTIAEPRKALQSAYGSAYNLVENPSEEGNFFGSAGRGRERYDDAEWTENTPNPHLGDNCEPMWTIFSSLFSLTLDYVFVFPPTKSVQGQEQEQESMDQVPQVTALLRTHRTETLQPGIPRKGVCASDHIAVGAEIVL